METKPPRLTCQELIEFIMSYLDGELPTGERSAFDRHLTACPSCVNYIKTYEKTLLLTKACAENAVPDDMPETLVQAILAARQKVE